MNSAPATGGTVTQRPRIPRIVLAGGGTLGILLGAAFVYQVARARLSQSIQTKIDRLALHPPEEMPELQWAILVYWTHNLHGASSLQTGATYPELQRLDHQVSTMLHAEPSREMIDTLWDQYASLTEGGARYRTRYEPIRDSILEEAAREGEAYFDRGSYVDFVASVRAANDR